MTISERFKLAPARDGMTELTVLWSPDHGASFNLTDDELRQLAEAIREHMEGG